MTHAYLVDGTRTPIGRYAGALASVRADDMAAHVIHTLMARFPAEMAGAIEEIILGSANQAGEDNRNVARMAGLLAGLPVEIPAQRSTGSVARAWMRSALPPAPSRPARLT